MTCALPPRRPATAGREIIGQALQVLARRRLRECIGRVGFVSREQCVRHEPRVRVVLRGKRLQRRVVLRLDRREHRVGGLLGGEGLLGGFGAGAGGCPAGGDGEQARPASAPGRAGPRRHAAPGRAGQPRRATLASHAPPGMRLPSTPRGSTATSGTAAKAFLRSQGPCTSRSVTWRAWWRGTRRGTRPSRAIA